MNSRQRVTQSSKLAYSGVATRYSQELPDPVAQLTDVVGDALNASTFVPTRPARGNERYSHGEFRRLHSHALAGRIDYLTFEVYTMEVRTEAPKRTALVDLLGKQLSTVTDGTGHVHVMYERMTLENFSVATLRAAAIVGPKEAATLIHDWLADGSWIQTLTFPLLGITVPERLNVRPGMSFRRLPEQKHEIFGHVPSGLANEMWRGHYADLLGATALCVESRSRPVLRNADVTPGWESEWALPGGFEEMFGHFLHALSLVCNTPVVEQSFWTASPPVQQAFHVGGAESWRSPTKGNLDQQPVELTGPLVDQALHFADKLRSAEEPVERVVGRWMNCSRERDAGEQLIECRIALEILFAAGGTHEAALRVAYHGARHLGRNLEERKALYRDLKDIYSNASTVIHGRDPRNYEKARDLVERAKDIIRDALLKILEDGEIPVWTDLMLKDV